MQQARMIGYRVQKYADSKQLSLLDLGAILECDVKQTKAFLKGRSFASFEQLVRLAQKLEISVSDLLTGDEEDYNNHVVHCMNGFQDNENREKILDIIDEYMDVFDSVS